MSRPDKHAYWTEGDPDIRESRYLTKLRLAGMESEVDLPADSVATLSWAG